jgi:hypothetical protein
MRLLDELHLAHPFLGARKLATLRKRQGLAVGAPARKNAPAAFFGAIRPPPAHA